METNYTKEAKFNPNDPAFAEQEKRLNAISKEEWQHLNRLYGCKLLPSFRVHFLTLRELFSQAGVLSETKHNIESNGFSEMLPINSTSGNYKYKSAEFNQEFESLRLRQAASYFMQHMMRRF